MQIIIYLIIIFNKIFLETKYTYIYLSKKKIKINKMCTYLI